jgi:hypothetical protein
MAVKLAVKEINAGTGPAGRKIEYTSFDTQTNPGIAKALAAKAVDSGPYVVIGPVFSGLHRRVDERNETRRGHERHRRAKPRPSRSRAIHTCSGRRSRRAVAMPKLPRTSRTR